jgi:hypothetical protein
MRNSNKGDGSPSWLGLVLAAWCLGAGFYVHLCESGLEQVREENGPSRWSGRVLAELYGLEDEVANGSVAPRPADRSLIRWVLQVDHHAEELVDNEDLNPEHASLSALRMHELRELRRKLDGLTQDYLLRVRTACAERGVDLSLAESDAGAGEWIEGVRELVCEETHILFGWFVKVGCTVDPVAERRVERMVRQMPESEWVAMLGGS